MAKVNDIVQYQLKYYRVLYPDCTIGVLANVDNSPVDTFKIIKLDYATINSMTKCEEYSLSKQDFVYEISERECRRLQYSYGTAEISIAEVERAWVTGLVFENGEIKFTFTNNVTHIAKIGDAIFFYANMARIY